MMCWVVGHLPEIDIVDTLQKVNITLLLMIALPILSLLIVLCMYARERKEQRKHVLFLQNFLSLFTNPDMQAVEIKE